VGLNRVNLSPNPSPHAERGSQEADGE